MGFFRARAAMRFQGWSHSTTRSESSRLWMVLPWIWPPSWIWNHREFLGGFACILQEETPPSWSYWCLRSAPLGPSAQRPHNCYQVTVWYNICVLIKYAPLFCHWIKRTCSTQFGYHRRLQRSDFRRIRQLFILRVFCNGHSNQGKFRLSRLC